MRATLIRRPVLMTSANVNIETYPGRQERAHLSSKIFSPPPNPFFQKRILCCAIPDNHSQTAKLDVAVFRGRPSRPSLKPIPNHQAKSLFRNILHLNPWGSIFYRAQAIPLRCNSNKLNILPARYIKKITGISPSLLVLVIAFAAIFSAPASAEILKVVVNDTIQPISEEYIARAIDEAHRRNAQAVLIEINTPGGLVDSTRQIIEHITASSVPVIIYVTPGGSRAASAGFFILESADIAAMAPGTNTGAAHPVILGGGKVDDVMKEKMENDAAALMRSVAARRGRNVDVAESTVRQSKSFTEQEALSQHLIDYVASSEEDLLRQIDGKTFKRFNGQNVTLKLSGQPLSSFDMTLKEKILAYLMDPNIAFLLLAIGALSLYLEFNHPGAVVPGTVGIVFILIATFALNLLPTRFAALVLILGAFALFAAEAKFATHGVLTIGGIALLTLGGLLLVDSPIPEMRVHLWTALAISIPFGLITAFLMTIALRARRNKVVTGAQGLVGETGVAQTALSPQGKVFVHGELWDAVASSPLPPGQLVVVRNINGLTLQVDPLAATPPTPTPAPAMM